MTNAPTPPAAATDDEIWPVLTDLHAERVRQDERWGEQNHPDGTGGPGALDDLAVARETVEGNAARGAMTWRDILQEEVAEAFAESDPVRLREELVQVAAVAAGWVQAIDRRGHTGSGPAD
ncbi:MAG: hypothetical protein WCA46_24870 [Actinocatenispora sp.]